MPLNDRKVISIILEQAKAVQPRYKGYREEVVTLVASILELERQHRVQGTTIQKKINDKCNAVARLLSDQRDGQASEDRDS